MRCRCRPSRPAARESSGAAAAIGYALPRHDARPARAWPAGGRPVRPAQARALPPLRARVAAQLGNPGQPAVVYPHSVPNRTTRPNPRGGVGEMRGWRVSAPSLAERHRAGAGGSRRDDIRRPTTAFVNSRARVRVPRSAPRFPSYSLENTATVLSFGLHPRPSLPPSAPSWSRACALALAQESIRPPATPVRAARHDGKRILHHRIGARGLPRGWPCRPAQHLRRLLREYVRYFNQDRPHQGVQQRVPDEAAVCPPRAGQEGSVRAAPVLGGLHHTHQRAA
jgi:hypothetical protein